jgi:uncharacterized protein
MLLDALASRQRQVELFERYGALLTPHQRDVLDLYLRQDWSLSEVATRLEISRAAVHDLVRRAGQALEEYEVALGLLRRRSDLRRALEEMRAQVDRLAEAVDGI